MMYFTQSPPETSAHGRLRNCRDELDMVISMMNTLSRSIECNEDETYHSDMTLISLLQSDLTEINLQLKAIQDGIVPERIPQ